MALKGQSTLAKKQALTKASISATDEALEDREETVQWKSKIKAERKETFLPFLAIVNVGNWENCRKKWKEVKGKMPLNSRRE